MNTYTLNGQKYYVRNDYVYVARDVTHGVDEIDDELRYLYEGRLVRIDPRRDPLKIWESDPDYANYVPFDEFEGATPMEPLTPDNIAECPECSGWLGPKDEPENHFCLDCGYGIDSE